MNQSTLSKHIQALERELEAPLFRRSTRVVELTDYGQTFLPYAQSIVRTQFEYTSALRRLRDSRETSFVLDCVPTLAQYGFADLLLAFRKAYPDCAVKVEENDPYDAIRRIQQRQCDLALSWDQPTPAGVVERIPFTSDRLVAVVARDHLLAGRGTIPLRELREELLCFPRSGTYLYDLCRKSCQEAGFVPYVVCDSDRLENILNVVADGRHTALFMAETVEYVRRRTTSALTGYEILDLTPEIRADLSLYRLRDGALSPAAGRFLDFFRSWITAGGRPDAG